MNEVERFAKEKGFSKLVAIVERKNENAASVVKWFYKLEYQWEIVEGMYVNLNQPLQALEKEHDSIYLSKKI